jgi:quercetin dioxygenase-like cupin family protein
VQFTYVLKGWVKMQYEGEKPIVMRAGSCFFQPARIKHREIAHAKDLEMLEVAAPQRFRTYDAKVR